MYLLSEKAELTMESALERLDENIRLLAGTVAGIEQIMSKAETLNDLNVVRALPFVRLFWLYASGINDLLNARRRDGKMLWNPAALAALTRPLQESFLNFFYFVIERTSDSESEFRQLLIQRHACFKELDLLSRADMKADGITRRQEEAKVSFENAQAELIAHPFFAQLPKEVRDKVQRNRDQCLFEPNQDIWDRAGMPSDLYEITFRYLSQWAHATPYAMSSLRFNRANDEDGAVNMNVPVALAFMCSARLLEHFSSLTPALAELLPQSFRQFMEMNQNI